MTFGLSSVGGGVGGGEGDGDEDGVKEGSSESEEGGGAVNDSLRNDSLGSRTLEP